MIPRINALPSVFLKQGSTEGRAGRMVLMELIFTNPLIRKRKGRRLPCIHWMDEIDGDRFFMEASDLYIKALNTEMHRLILATYYDDSNITEDQDVDLRMSPKGVIQVFFADKDAPKGKRRNFANISMTAVSLGY